MKSEDITCLECEHCKKFYVPPLGTNHDIHRYNDGYVCAKPFEDGFNRVMWLGMKGDAFCEMWKEKGSE